jgi:hypothetical protein
LSLLGDYLFSPRVRKCREATDEGAFNEFDFDVVNILLIQPFGTPSPAKGEGGEYFQLCFLHDHSTSHENTRPGIPPLLGLPKQLGGAS